MPTLLKRLLQHLAILTFLWFSAGGFFYTMTHRWPPFIPWRLAMMSYGMMGPWQGYTLNNSRIVARGLTKEGQWESIDLEAYFPFLRGETGIRMLLRPFRNQKRGKYRGLAQRLLELEANKGRTYSSVRLSWEKWPKSPLGFHARRTKPWLTETFLTQAP
jgi:hypothetical protein